MSFMKIFECKLFSNLVGELLVKFFLKLSITEYLILKMNIQLLKINFWSILIFQKFLLSRRDSSSSYFLRNIVDDFPEYPQIYH